MLGVRLRSCASGCEAEPFGLPSHTRDRLVAAAHLEAIASGALPNGGRPLSSARIALVGAGEESAIRVELAGEGGSYERCYERLTVWDDIQVLVAQLSASGAIGKGLYRFALVELPEPESRPHGLRLAGFERALPPLPVVSLRDAGIDELPRCPHPSIFVPRDRALALLAHARATPEVEVGAFLLVTPFLIAETVPVRLGVYLVDAIPLGEGTSGDACRLRVPPAALAAAPDDPARNRRHGGLAHSHPGCAGHAHFLSADDRALATAFYYCPYQIQLVVDPQEADPQDALAAFAWVDGRIARVCFRLLDEA
jgi:hypothetical protein